MEDQVPEAIKSARLQRLFEMHNKMAFEIVKRYEGMILDILVEEVKEGRASGRSSQNKLTFFAGSEDLVGKTVPVKITKAAPAVLRGELVQ
jgi:tRNA-2-methylthio-N6-dimethylallyladenosine synthase